MRGGGGSVSFHKSVFVCDELHCNQGLSSYKLAVAIFPPSAFCRLVRLKRVLRFRTYCYQIQ